MNNKSGLPPFVRRYNTRFYFRFVIETPRLTEAACYGTTETQFTQTVSGQVENIERNIEPGRPSRFPRAIGFYTPEQASLECDRWRYRLNQDFSVPIERWSCGSIENLMCDIKANLDCEMSIEFQDFVSRNLDALESHRASQDNSEKQLQWLAKHGDATQRQRALSLIAKQAELLAFCQRNDVDTLRKKADSFAHYARLASSPLDALAKATNGIEGQALREAITQALTARLTVLSECETILMVYEKLKTELYKLKNT